MTLPSIVFVHGAGGGAWEWSYWQAVFEDKGWSTFAMDLLPTEAGVAETQVDDYVQQIIHCLDDAQFDQPPFVIAASMGGPLSLKAMESTVVAGLVLINSLPVRGVEGWPTAQVSFPEVIPWAAKGLAERSLQKMSDYDESIAQLVEESWRDESGRVLNTLYAGLAVNLPNCACLVVTGRDDEDVPSVLSSALASYLQADYMAFRGVSHLGALLGSRAEEIAVIVAEWLENIVIADQDLSGLSL